MSEKIENIQEYEIDLKQLYKGIMSHKIALFSTLLIVFFISLVYVYTSKNVYQANALMQIDAENPISPNAQLLASLSGASINSIIENEVEILTSRFLAKRVINKIPEIRIKYFKKKFLKTKEFYKNSPFVVSAKIRNKVTYATNFNLEVIDKNSFILSAKPGIKYTIISAIKKLLNIATDEEMEPITYKQKHYFGKIINTPWFEFSINKIKNINQNEKFSFNILNENQIIENFNESLNISAAKSGSSITFSYQDSIKKRSEEILELFLNEYERQNLEYRNLNIAKTTEFIDEQLRGFDDKLKKSAKNLEGYKEQNALVNFSGTADVTAKRLSELEKELYEIEIQNDVMQSLKDFVSSNKDLANIALSTGLSDQNIQALLKDIQDTITLRASLLVDYTNLHPDVIKANQKLNSLKKTLLNLINSNLRIISTKKEKIQSGIDKITSSLETLPAKEQKLITLTRDFKSDEAIYNFLLQKRAEAAIAQASSTSKLRVLSEVYADDKPIKPKKSLILVVALVTGFILGIFISLLLEFLDDSIKDIDDISSNFSLPIYGAIPEYKAKNKTAFDESLRVIRTNLEFIDPDLQNKCKVITITSTISGEGKTTIIAELAKVMAQSEKKVLLLDMDLRRSTLHKKLFLENTNHGVSTLLSGKYNTSEVIKQYNNQTLDIITSGPTPPNPSELIMSKSFKKILIELKEQYDYIFIDSPPVGYVTDATILLQNSDIGIIITRIGISKKDTLKNTVKLVKTNHLKNVGIVVNSYNLNKKSYGYGYGYGY